MNIQSVTRSCRSFYISNYSSNLHTLSSTVLAKDIATLLGPRDIYDAAHEKEKVLSVPYKVVLDIPRRLQSEELQMFPTDKIETSKSATGTIELPSSDDLLIIAKIMRRAPRLQDKVLSKQRHQLAQDICHISAVMGNIHAMLFWSESVLRSVTSIDSERSEAMTMLTNLAQKQQNGKANYLIANELYSLGEERKAMKAYRLAGEQGVAEAYTKLGRILRQQGYHKNSIGAFRLAAVLGEPNAQFMMSTFSNSESEKISYLQKAAANGKEEAAHNLGEIYRRKGQDKLAKEFLETAARKGFQISQMNLASLLRKEKDFSGAKFWYAEAIKAGGEVGSHAESLLSEMKTVPDYSAEKPTGGCAIM